MTDPVNPKWSDLPNKVGFESSTWEELPGRFRTEVADRCEDFGFTVCTLCGAIVDGYWHGLNAEKHTDYHRKQGF